MKYLLSMFAVILLGVGCAQTAVFQPSAVDGKAYVPENQVAVAQGSVFVEREHFSGMQHCSDVIHVFRGQKELFHVTLVDCLPTKETIDQNLIYRYQFAVSTETPTTFTFFSKTDPTFSILDDNNIKHSANEILLQVNEKTIIFNETSGTFVERSSAN